MKTENYKKIILNLEENFGYQDRLAINELFIKFPNPDITYNMSDKEMTVFLNKLDLIKFKTEINRIKSNNISISLAKTLDTIIFNIEAIKSYSLKGKKRIYIGYNKERKVKGRKGKEINRIKYYYADGNKFSRNNIAIPSKYENKIICGDSLKVLKNMPDNCVDLVFTSPPYNFGLDYESNEDSHYWDKYFKFLFKIFDECIRVLKYGGRIIVNVQPLFSDYIPSHHIISNYFMSKKLIWKGEILWEKNNYNCKYTAWGSWKSPSSPYLKYTWEFLEVFSKGTLKKEGNRKNADITADEFKKWVLSKWSIAPERNMKKYNHPAMFPEELVIRVLKLFSFQNDIILDPFNGVGTTSYIAKITGRRYIGIDISEEYCKKAKDRIGSTLF